MFLLTGFAVNHLSLDLAEELALVAQLLLEVVGPLEAVSLVVSEESTVRANLFPVCCAYDVHHDLVLGAHLAERW